MPRASFRTLSLLLALAGAGCAPLPLQVYVSDLPDGKVIYSTCKFNTHVPVGVRVSAAGIETLVSVARHEGRDYVEARFDVPEGYTLALADGIVLVDTADPKTSSRAEFPAVSLVDTPIVNHYSPVPSVRQQQLPVTAQLVGRQVAIGSVSSPRHFWMATYAETASAMDLWLTFPRITINGAPASLPRFHFRRQSVDAVATINC